LVSNLEKNYSSLSLCWELNIRGRKRRRQIAGIKEKDRERRWNSERMGTRRKKN
jgi:hypothetical protein